jgi:replicative DNA helicase
VENRVGADANDTNSKRPQLSDLRESGAIEQDADMVCFIHRPEYYKIYKDQYGRDTHGVAEIIIAKHRNGEVKDVRLKFQGEYARFSDWYSEEEMPPLPEDDGLTRPSKVNSINKDNADPGFSSITADMAPADLGPDGDIPPF